MNGVNERNMDGTDDLRSSLTGWIPVAPSRYQPWFVEANKETKRLVPFHSRSSDARLRGTRGRSPEAKTQRASPKTEFYERDGTRVG